MLGEILGEGRGKRILRRVLSTEPVEVEVTFEESGQMLGLDYNGNGTYTSIVRPDGTIYGEGNGVYITREGELASWKGSGLGRFQEGGAVSYRGVLYYRTASQKLAKLNTTVGVFEFEVGADGQTHGKVWEWK